jgi:hypothetical protein
MIWEGKEMTMRGNRFFILIAILLLGFLLLSGCDNSSVTGGPTSWIDAPHNGSSYVIQGIHIISHSNEPGGLAQVEVSANGKIIETEPASGTFAQTMSMWYPDAPGNYVLRVRAQSKTGVWGGYAEANVTIVGETPTLIPSITPTGVIPTITFTPPVVKSGLTFKANKSASQVYYGSCGTNSVTIQAFALGTNQVHNITLFISLKDPQSGATTGWDAGEAMNPAGNGWFQRTINVTSIPKYNAFANSWVLYQFVATGSDGSIFGKSSVFSDIALSGCAAPPARIEPPRVAPVVTLTPKKGVPPPIRVVPTKTLIPGPK